MCDPITLIATAIGAFAANEAGDSAPAPSLPTAAPQDATEETGAEVILGSEVDEATGVSSTEEANKTKKKTSGSGLNTGNTPTGISIL